MDTARGLSDERDDEREDSVDAGVNDAMFDLGGDERRMHVRAYNHWVSLLKGRAYPPIAELDPETITDFGPHSVLLDFSDGVTDPGIAFLGRALREECGLQGTIATIADVPGRSLLSRLTDHYLQIIANRAPIGFEAEFVGSRGRTTLYRGILMPFSSSGDGIDYIYGVINWKEMVDDAMQATLDAELGAELEAAVRAAPSPTADAPIWADGPSAGFDMPAAEPALDGSLGDQLTMARESAAAVRAADTRGRAALYRALGRAHDFALAADADADGYAAILADACIAVQARAPMTPIVKLVFGVDYDKTRLTEFAAVLTHARRNNIPAGGLAAFLEAFDGGVKAIVAAERAARKPESVKPAVRPLADRAVIAHIAIDSGAAPGDTVLLVARVGRGGGLDIVGTIAGDKGLNDRAVRAIG